MPDVLERLQSAVADRYRIVRELEPGGMARVFVALDLKHTARQVVIKVLTPGVASQIGVERFEREIEIVSNLAHPYIVPLFDSGVADGLRYFVMEFVEGESLRARLRREKRLPIEDALRLAREVAEAAGFAHAHGSVHRDLKPENILLEAGHAKVVDFGIARPVHRPDGRALTTTSQLPATPAYMSPEQAMGSPDLDGRSDQYSLACVLYEMLTGEPPFVADTREGFTYEHAHTVAPLVRRLRTDTPIAVAKAIERAMAKRPADRFATMEEFAAAISSKSWFTLPVPSPRAVRGMAASIAGLGLLAAVAWLVFFPPWKGLRGVAVTDFRNLTGDAGLDYLGKGLSADLLDALMQGTGLLLTRGLVHDAGGQVEEDPRAIARELGVRVVITGDILHFGHDMQLRLRVVDGLTGYIRWGRTFEFAISNALDMREAMYAEVVQKLPAGPRSRIPPPRSSAPTSNAAFEAYVRGRGELENAEDPLARERAWAAFAEAIRQDSTFALAWAGKARALWWLYDRDSDPEHMRLASEAVDRAVRLRPDIDQVHVARARIHLATGAAREAVDELRDVLRRNPNYDEVHLQLGRAYRKLGDMARAEASFRQAVALRPASWANWQALGNFLLGAAKFPEARAAYGKVITLKPESNRGYEGLGNACLLERRYPEAIAAYSRMPLPVTKAQQASNFATAYYYVGKLEEAARYYLMAVGFEPEDAESRRNLGDCYARMGRTREAREQYGKALDLTRAALQVAPGDVTLGMRLTVCFAKAGECDSSAAWTAAWAPRVPAQDADLQLELAKAYALCKRDHEAIAALQRLVDLGAPALKFHDEDEFRSLRTHPEFKKLLASAEI